MTYDPNKRGGPYLDVAIREKAIRYGNWGEARCNRTFFSGELPLDSPECDTRPGQRIWLLNALRSLTRDEVILMYDESIRSHRDCLENGGDFTPQYVRDTLPHLYPVYEIHATQGQGGVLVEKKNSLKEALQYVQDHEGRASFGIKYPDGTWHKWEK